MKHLVTYAEGGRIELAYVEDDTGELTQIGRLIWPDGFGLTEAAILGTNLTAFLQLNGHKTKRKTTTPPALMPAGAPAPDVDVETPRELSHLEKRALRHERKKAQQREYYHRTKHQKKSPLQHPDNWDEMDRSQRASWSASHRYTKAEDKPPKAEPKKRGSSRTGNTRGDDYIYLEWVVDVVNRHPEGIRSAGILADLGIENSKRNRMAIDNRIHMALKQADRGTPMPFRIERRREGSFNTRYLYPL